MTPDAVRPLLAAERRARLPVIGAVTAGVLLFVGLSAAAPVVPLLLGWFGFTAAYVLVPAGIVLGVVLQVLQCRRHRAERGLIGPPTARAALAAQDATGLQAADWMLDLALLIGGVLGGALFAGVTSISERPGYIDGNATTPGAAVLALTGVLFGLADLLLVAIPVAAVIAVRQIRDREGAAGEEFALRARCHAYRRIRARRLVSVLTRAGYVVALTVVIVAADARA